MEVLGKGVGRSKAHLDLVAHEKEKHYTILGCFLQDTEMTYQQPARL